MINFKSLLSTLIGVATLSIGLANTAQASTFVEDVDTGQRIPSAQGVIEVPEIDKIEGSLFSPADIDLYQFQSERQAFFEFSVNEALFSPLSLFLFDEMGKGLAAGIGEVGFNFSDNETFYLGISDGLNPLNSAGEILLSPSGEENTGTLAGWQDPGIVLPVVIPYEIAIEVETQTVPEPFTIVGQGIALGLGLIYTRRKQKTKV